MMGKMDGRQASWRRDGWLWTVGLVGGGLLLLAWNLGFFVAYEPWPQYSFALLLAGVGISFFVGYMTDATQWWRLIPGWTMVALAAMLLLSMLPTPPVRLIAALLFWGMALAFAQIYLLQRVNQWWAIIPGGFMLVLGTIIALSGMITDIELLGALLFVGMGSVFYLLYALSTQGRQWWALIPGSVLFAFGIFIAVAQRTAEGELSSGVVRWWPLFLILGGLVVGWWTYRTPAPLSTVTNPTVTKPTATNPAVTKSTADKPTHFANLLRKVQKTSDVTETGRLGEYSQPAPGATIDIVSDADSDEPQS